MSVVSVKLLSSTREHGEDLSVRASDRYAVAVNDRTDNELTVILATGIPRVGDLYITTDGEAISSLLVTGVRVERSEESPYLWYAEVDYGTTSRDPARQNENPLLRPADIAFDFAKYRKLLTRAWNPDSGAYDGAPVVNSAGVPIEVEVDDTRLVLSITRNEAAYNPALAFAYRDAINSDVWFGGQPFQWKVQEFSGRLDHQFGQSFWVVSYAFEFRLEGWRGSVLDAGRSEFISSSGKLQTIVDDAGSPAAEPVPLNGQGRKLSIATTTLTLGMDAVTNSISPSSFANFPTGGLQRDPPVTFDVKIDSEEIRIDGIGDAGLYHCERAVNGTTAAAHTNGSTVRMRPYYGLLQMYPELPFRRLRLPGGI